MSTAFSRTLQALRVDRFRPGATGILTAIAVVAAWTAWCCLAHITLYEVSDKARLEVDRAAYPIDSPLLGRIVRSDVAIGRNVKAGDILIEFDSEPEQLQLREERTKLSALLPQIAAMRSQIAAEELARSEEQRASAVSAEGARSAAKEADVPVKYADIEERRLNQLKSGGLIAERDYLRGKADSERYRAAAESQQIAIRRIEQEQKTRASDRAARIRTVETERSKIEAQIPPLQASIHRLEYEIERRRIRAPIEGRIGEAAILRTGSVLQEGGRIGTVVPSGGLAIIAQFPPPAAMGRIHEGQAARLRLEGFPWMQYGSVPAVVSRVSNEVRDGVVRVEFHLEPQSRSPIPMQHGLPGTVEVEVERITPIALILRNAGRMVTETRSAF